MKRKAESQRKKRQGARPLPADVIEDRIAENVEAVAAAHKALAVERHFAGYWNELGLRIDVPPETSAEALVALGNALIECMTQVTSGVEMPFQWQIGIYSNDALVRVVSPGDPPSMICPDCRQEQRAGGPSCIVCGQSL